VPDGSIPPLTSNSKSWVNSPYGDYVNSDTNYLVSNCFDLTNANRQIIEFKYWLASEINKDGFSVEYTANDGATWILVDSSKYSQHWNWYRTQVEALGTIGHSGFTSGWELTKELLPASLNSEHKVKFRIKWASDDENNGRGLAIDNFRIYPAPPDIGVSYIDIPRDACQFENPDSIKVYVKNYGYTALTPLDTIIVGADFESQAPVIGNFHLTSDLFPGDSAVFKMYLPMEIDNPGVYNLFAYTMIEDNPHYYNSNNDTSWKSFQVWQNPITNLADSIYSRQPDTVVIRPRIEPEYSYLWLNKGNYTTADSIKVIGPGYYFLTVTESVHGCQTNDSIWIQLLFNDVGVDSIIWPRSSCELSNAEKVEVQIKNFGTDSLIAGDKVKVYYQIDGGTVIQDSVTLNSSLRSGYRKWFRFDHNTVDFSAERDYTIKSYAYFGGDTLLQNDTIIRQITVFGYPQLNIGNDTTIKALSYTLEADPSFESYLWNDGDTLANKLIEESGTYSLTATDVHGCPAADTINIWFKIRDIRAYSLLSPVSSCERSGTDQVKLKIQNFGTDTINITDDIIISYKLNSDSRVSQTIHVSNLYPGVTSEYLFSPSVNLTVLGTYNFNTTATTTGDLRPTNDTLNKVIYTKPNPAVDLGIEDGQQFKLTSYTFDAGAGLGYAYLWQDGSTNRFYTATNSGKIKSLVTDTTTGCYGGDTVDLYLDILDYRVASVSIDSSTCQGKYEDVIVQVRNSGNQSRGGAQFTLKYLLNNNLLFTEDYTQTTNWFANTSKSFTVRNPIYLNNSGNNQLKIIINHIGDLRPENDTLTKQLTVKTNPIVNLGGPTIYTRLPYTIDAGPGQLSYLWNTGATTSTLSVTQDGIYTVTVTGTNGCKTKSSVGINVELVGIIGAIKEGLNVNIFPNPASDQVTIEAVFSHEGTYILEIYNVQNTLILSKEINTADYKESLYIGDLQRGIYFIRIRNNDTYNVSKLIIQ
jgi:hypothetical protein